MVAGTVGPVWPANTASTDVDSSQSCTVTMTPIGTQIVVMTEERCSWSSSHRIGKSSCHRDRSQAPADSPRGQ